MRTNGHTDSTDPTPGGVRRRSFFAAAAGAAGAATLAAGCGTSDAQGGGAASPTPSASTSRSPSPKPTRRRPELPRGGRRLFPEHRLVGYCGLPGAAALGRLGTGDLDDRVAEIERRGRAYADGRTVLPVLELLAVVANSSAGPDGTYRSRVPDKTIRTFHEAARDHKALLLLNIQPGRAAPLDEVKALREWLVHPDVGIALDPEWEMSAGQVPGKTYGRTSGDELTRIAAYLASLVEEHDLPEKVFVYHQVAESVVRDEHRLKIPQGVAVVKSADGIGSPHLKRETWRQLVDTMPPRLHTGFKLFFEEDAEGGSRLMTPDEVLALKPRPSYVMYE
ncbi:hypothetical protein OKJ48_10410 [Streptomyces kunmingensis]|uniref:Lipoprotein n=1 Tax=Streptomyces kunmingensis TaxID=68225 RepID=A0ABU6C9X5_9ACTN|nr:hypothetical protein [Streptomyces kunmingensis]MEB3960650.1 hypothetical protein [Streptomyces kunmingensis]